MLSKPPTTSGNVRAKIPGYETAFMFVFNGKRVESEILWGKRSIIVFVVKTNNSCILLRIHVVYKVIDGVIFPLTPNNFFRYTLHT